MPITTVLDNRTPFAAQRFVLPDHEGQERTVAVVAATFDIDADGKAAIADEQDAVRAADLSHADPATSSVRHEAEVALEKPFIDVLVNGRAHAPRGRAVSSMQVGLSIGPLTKTLHVCGDRGWRRGLLGREPGSPRPFQHMPLIWERAFGGQARGRVELRNPVGLGFAGETPARVGIDSELPNIEYLDDRLRFAGEVARPAGLGVVGRGWQPRLALAGTFDAKWLDEQWPFLPLDFDARHYQAAPSDQQCERLDGGELVTLFQMTPEGTWRFRLPSLHLPIHCFFDDRYERRSARLDTVLIEPDERKLRLTSRLSITTDRARGSLRAMVVGEMSRAWLRARIDRKAYIDTRRLDGALPQAVHAKLHA